MTESQQQTREQTPDERFRTLFERTAKLNDAVSALLAPAWGAKAGIIPEGHPLHPAQQGATLGVVRDEQTPDAVRELASAVRDLASAVRLEVADRTDAAEPRLLDCGWCYEENGEEVHPHPECPIGAASEQAAPVDWQAIVKQRERELKKVGEARYRAETAITRVREYLERHAHHVAVAPIDVLALLDQPKDQ